MTRKQAKIEAYDSAIIILEEAISGWETYVKFSNREDEKLFLEEYDKIIKMLEKKQLLMGD